MIDAALVCGLAGWRLASLLVAEEGPWEMFTRLRKALDAEGPGPLHFWRGLFGCVWCMSVWCCALMIILWQLSPWIPAAFAAMGAAIVVEQWAHPPKPKP